MIQHLESLIDEAIASLRAGLNDHLETLNAETGAANPSGMTLEAIPGDDFLFGGFDIVRYPCVEVAAPDWSLLGWSLHQLSADLSAAVMARVWVMDATAELVYRRALRYGRAIVDVLAQPDAFGPLVVIDPTSGVRGSYRFNPETGQHEEIFGSGVVVFNLEGGETRSLL
jgi:hypothetical protein